MEIENAISRLLLVRGARQLLTLNGPEGPRRGEALQQLGVVEDGAVLIENGVILAVGPTRRVENLSIAKGAVEINASGRVVMPGFVDASTQLVSAPRGLAGRSSRPESQYLKLLRSTPARALLFQASKFMRFCARHGTTTIEMKSGPLADEPTQLKLLRIFAEIHTRPAHAVATYWASPHVIDPGEVGTLSLSEWHTEHLLPRIASRQLAQVAEAPSGAPHLSGEETRSFLLAAKAAGLRLKIQHVGGTARDTIQLADQCGVMAVEGVHEPDVQAARSLALLPSVVILSPFSVKDAGMARTLIDEGAALGLATCFHDETQPIFSMQMVIGAAVRQLRLTPEEAISATTINGAWATGEARRTGSLQFGKDADLLLLNIADYREIPHYHGANLVHMTMRRGEIVFREGELSWPNP